MCDQDDVSYQPGNVVWVKLGPVWWPGVVADNEEISSEILKPLRKTPIAIVKFFQEKGLFEYVHKLSNINHYNCLKKNDFIRKGLDMYRSKNRDAPSNMKLFPEDVARAEVLTGGDPNILNDDIFQPEEKPVYSDIFGSTKKCPKRIKPETKKKSLTQAVTQQSNVQRIITHPRFIKLSSGMETDYEVRERKQEPLRAECDEEDNSPPTTYRCQNCDFTTIRLNVIVLHNKSHIRNYSKPTSLIKATKRKNISAVRVKERPSISESKSLQPAEPIKPRIPETNGTVPTPRKRGRPKKVVELLPTAPTHVTTKTKEPEPKTNSRTQVVKPKRSTPQMPQKDEFQESLLEDWAEFETDQDNSENRDTSFGSSVVDTCTNETITVDENHSANKRDEFDFDDSEEQLVIDKSKIRAGRKIPRVLEGKSDELTNNDTEIVRKRKMSGARGKPEETKVKIQEATKKTETDNMRKRRMSKRKSEETQFLPQEDRKNSSQSINVKKRKITRKRSTHEEEKKEARVENETGSKNDNMAAVNQTEDNKEAMEMEFENIEEVTETNVEEIEEAAKTAVEKIEEVKETDVEETDGVKESVIGEIEESNNQIEIEERHEEIEVGGEIEIEIEQTTDDDDEPSPIVDITTSVTRNEKDEVKEKETVELSQKVDQLLQEISVPSKLPELPRSLKKEHIKSYNASLTKQDGDDDNDDQIIESISLINDDSSDGLEEKSQTESDQALAQVVEKNHSNNELENDMLKTTIVDTIENIEVTSDSSPEIVSVEIPTRGSGSAKKSLTNVHAETTITTEKRAPIRFTMTSKLKNINSNQVTKRSANPMFGTSSAKMFKSIPNQPQQLQGLQQSKARSVPVFNQGIKPYDGRHIIRLTQAGASSLNNKLYLVKQGQASRPATIANIDLTGSKGGVVSTGATKSARLASNVQSKSLRDLMQGNKRRAKSVLLGSPAPIHKSISSVELVTSSSNSKTLTHLQEQTEIITVSDDIECPDGNEQTEEMNYIVDEAGNVIAENACSSSRKEDILAKALQNTDGLQTEIALSNSSTIVLEPCNIVQNTPSTSLYENVTLSTPPIMSSFETPSRTINANSISEISDYIIISDAADNIQ